MSVEQKKKEIRQAYLKILSTIPPERREEAEKAAFQELKEETNHAHYVLSFASKKEELRLWHLNLYLAAKGQLVLTRVMGNHLVPYLVEDLEKDLQLGAFNIYEPDSTRCKELPIETIDLMIIPGLAFDKQGHRIGYGKGYYDRFLENIYDIKKIGVGYKEQLYPENLPQEDFDRPVTVVKLF
jgi:5-formyltetrahydrofolate cyclo-ligase